MTLNLEEFCIDWALYSVPGTDLTFSNTWTYTLSNIGMVIPIFQTKELRLQRVNKLFHVIKLLQDCPRSHGLSFEPELGTNPLKVVLKQGVISTPDSWGFPSTNTLTPRIQTRQEQAGMLWNVFPVHFDIPSNTFEKNSDFNFCPYGCLLSYYNN